MPVVVADQVRRPPVLSADLDDLGHLVVDTDGPAMDVKPVAQFSVHANPLSKELSP
jgi:hypothetical protein